MKTGRKKFMGVLLGLLTGAVVWTSAILLSGTIAFGDVAELYDTGWAVFLFPFVYAAACIFAAKIAVKKSAPAYFKASIVFLLLPIAFSVIVMLLAFVGYSDVIAQIQVICSIPFMPLASVLTAMFDCLDSIHGLSEFTITAIAIAANIIPSLVGLITAFGIFTAKKHEAE